jgi:hypothetical protein
VREPRETADQPERRQDARRGKTDEQEWRRRMMHHVEEWHSAKCHLPPGMRLADSQQCREMGHDAEEEEHPQSKAVLG